MKLYKEASLMMIPTSVKDGKLYSIFPQPKPLSGELITNGGFDDGSSWGTGTGWSIGGGKASFDGSTAFQQLQQIDVTQQNKNYKLTFNLSNVGSSVYRVRLISGGSYNKEISVNGDGTYVAYFVSNTGLSNTFGIQNDNNTGSSYAFDIDNISVVEVDQLPADFDFSRGSNLAATRINEQGLIEKGRENLFTYSNEFTNSAWNSYSNGLTRTASNITDPDGGANAWEITTTATNEHHRLGHTMTSGKVKTISFYAKANGYEYVRVWAFSGGNTNSNYFHLSGEGATGGNGQLNIKSIESVGNGWYRCQCVLDPNNNAVVVISPAPDASTASGTATYLADGASGIYLYNAQLEVGLVATDYIESGATTGKAGVLEDLPRLDWSGSCPTLLLEPQRTNLVEYSEYGGGFSVIDSNITKTDNATTSPEGIDNAVKLEGITGSSGNQAVIFGGLSNTSVVDRTFTASVYIKPVNAGDVGQDITLSIQRQTGDFEALIVVTEIDSADWKRYDLTYTFTGAGAGDQVGCVLKILRQDSTIDDVYVYGAQLEEGSYATSYIPTRGQAATRAYDRFDNTDLGDYIGTGDATFFFDFDFDVVAREGSNMLYRVYSGTDSFGIKGTSTSNRNLQLRADSGFVNDVNISSAANTSHKIIARVTGDVVEVFYNGTKLTDTMTGFSTYSWSELRVNAQTSFLGKTKEITVFDTALSDNECINLTSI